MNAPFRIRPFGFDQIFTAVDTAGVGAAGDRDPWLQIETLRAELAIARQEAADGIAAARSEGFLAGQAQARNEQGAALLAATDAIHGAIESVEEALDTIAETSARDAAAVALAAAELLAARALDTDPARAIDDAIGRALRQVARGQEIEVVVHPILVAPVEQVIAARQTSDRRRLRLRVSPDLNLALGDAHIHWDQGGIVLEAAARAEAITAALAGLLPTG